MEGSLNHNYVTYVQGVSELVARHLRPYNLNITHKLTESLQKTLVHVKDPLPTQRRRNVVYRIPCSECPFDLMRIFINFLLKDGKDFDNWEWMEVGKLSSIKFVHCGT